MTTTLHSTEAATDTRTVDVCAADFLIPGRGVAALLPDGSQAAVFRLPEGGLYAVDNIDPVGRAAVLSRGIVGDRSGVPVVFSPLGKQAFSLEDGHCLDDDAVAIRTYPVREDGGRIVLTV